MKIGIAIYGNMTGFSRFFANEEAKTALSETRLNFDVHNLVTFLKNSDKLYAIFFSKNMAVACLITNILDSFRRPGNLVVSVIIPRKYRIIRNDSPDNKEALFDLLNEINDKFYQENMEGEMPVQDPLVVRRDLYSDIISNYSLQPDPTQKNVNFNIDAVSATDKSGYIKTKENDVPKYLSSLYRESYEGYRHIFFGADAPQNISEPATESVLYTCRIKNRNQSDRKVRLQDRIPQIFPQKWENKINEDFTIQQILNGESEHISADIDDRGILWLSYDFPVSKKTVEFQFLHGEEKVDIRILQPYLENPKSKERTPIPYNRHTFYGKDIFEEEILRCENPEYSIKVSSQTINPERMRDDEPYPIYVQKVKEWVFEPKVNGVKEENFKPVNILLHNKRTLESKSFKDKTHKFSDLLSGDLKDWEMTVTSKYYDEVTTSADNSDLTLVSKSIPAYDSYSLENENRKSDSNNSRLSGNDAEVSQVLSFGNSAQPAVSQNQNVTVSSSDGVTEASSGIADKHNIMVIGSAVACVLIIIVGFLFRKELFGGGNEVHTKTVKFLVQDPDGKGTSDSSVADLVIIGIATNGNNKFLGDNEWEIEYTDDEKLDVYVELKCDSLDIYKKEGLYIKDLKDPYNITLPITLDILYKLSEVLAMDFTDSKNFNPDQINIYIDAIVKSKSKVSESTNIFLSKLQDKLQNLLKDSTPTDEGGMKSKTPIEENKINNALNETTVELKEVKKIYNEGNCNTANKNRCESIFKILEAFKDVTTMPNPRSLNLNLSTKQEKIAEDIYDLHDSIRNDKNLSSDVRNNLIRKFKDELAKEKVVSLYQAHLVYGNVNEAYKKKLERLKY